MRRAVCTIALMNEPALSASERLSSDLGTINAKRPLSSSFLRYVRRAARISSLYTPGSSSTECQGTVTAVTVFFPEGISAVPEAAFSRETTFSSDVLNVRLSSMRTREFFSARNKGFCFIFYPALKTTFKLKKKRPSRLRTKVCNLQSEYSAKSAPTVCYSVRILMTSALSCVLKICWRLSALLKSRLTSARN